MWMDVQLNAASHARCKALQILGTPSFCIWISCVERHLTIAQNAPYQDTETVGEQGLLILHPFPQ